MSTNTRAFAGRPSRASAPCQRGLRGRPSLSGAALALAATILCGSAASAQTTWTMPTPYPDGNFHTKNDMAFIADVDKATGGKLKIELHSNGALVKHPEIKAAVRRGTAQIGEVLISLHANESPIFGVDSIPFLATGYDASKKLYAAQKPFLEKKLADEGLVLLYSVAWPPQGIYARKEIKSLEELKGLKFRTYNPATQAIAKEVGAIPTQVEQADLATAFSTGRVEATITSPATGVDSKMWDFVTVYHDTQAWLPRNVVFVNKAAFDALSADEKAAVLAAAKAAEERGWAASADVTVSATKALADNKISVVQPTPELKSGFQAVGARIADEWVAKAGPDGVALLEAYKK